VPIFQFPLIITSYNPHLLFYQLSFLFSMLSIRRPFCQPSFLSPLFSFHLHKYPNSFEYSFRSIISLSINRPFIHLSFYSSFLPFTILSIYSCLTFCPPFIPIQYSPFDPPFFLRNLTFSNLPFYSSPFLPIFTSSSPP
jgi:hypothetical protein